MIDEDYKERAIAERAALLVNILKLDVFISEHDEVSNDVFTPIELFIMRQQEKDMRAYLATLDLWISTF